MLFMISPNIAIPCFFLDHFLADLLDVHSQAASHFGIKPTEMEHDLLVLGLHAFDNLHDDHILVVEVLYDIAGFLFTLDIAVVIALGHDAVFRCLPVLTREDQGTSLLTQLRSRCEIIS
jgi:hypothetical protein